MLHRLYLLGVGALAALTVTASLSASAAVGAEVRSMGPSVVQGDKSRVTEHFFGSTEVAHRVTASPWTAPAVGAKKNAASETGDRSKLFQVGYPRDIPASLRSLPLTSLVWQTLADGSQVARVEILAPDAAAFRIGYRVDGPAAGLQVRFAGIGRDEVYAAPVTPAENAWSPVLEGDTATLELRVLPGVDASRWAVTLDQLSHFVLAPASMGQKDIAHIGKAGACNIDVACVTNPSSALLDAAKAVAKMVYTDRNGRSILCTGTLLNSTSGANYFYSAAHCISTQAEAGTVNTYWFFDAIACGSLAIPPYQLVVGGANLLVTDLTLDVTLMQLRQSPPIGAVRAAWDATVIPTDTSLVGLHHPEGDLKMYSQGSMQGYVKGPQAYPESGPRTQFGKDSFISVKWVHGTTERGSSGSGVFTYNPSCGGGVACYELRGGLEGGEASCATPTGADRYSRMDLLFTKLAPFLRPSAVIPVSTAAQSSMVEFFNPQSDFYFISSRENEKGLLDGQIDGSGHHLWFRTGYWFKTDPAPSSQTSSITRYYIPGAAKGGTRGSHFYTALNSDKSAISATGKERFAPCDTVPNGFFCNEGTDSYIALPIKTANVAECLTGEKNISRVFRGPPRYIDDGNHRYTTDADTYDYMVRDSGWIGEGVNFCAKP